MADITIIGGDALVKSVRNRVGKDKVNRVIKRHTSKAQQVAMKNVAVDTGFLRRSITIELNPFLLTGAITAYASYAAYQEYGTRFQDGTPYMRPARNQIYSPFMSDLRALLRNG